MKGATPACRGDTPPLVAVKVSSVRAGSVPPPPPPPLPPPPALPLPSPGASCGTVLVDGGGLAGVVVVLGGAVGAGVVAVIVGPGAAVLPAAAVEEDPPPPEPPPQPPTSAAAAAAIASSDRMRLTRLQHHDLARGLPVDVGLERLRVGLDRRERVVVARDHLLRAHELGGPDAVLAVHRVVPADAHQRHVDLVALLHELEVREEA